VGSQLRYYYDMSIVRPREDGHPRQIALMIWDREPAPSTFEIESTGADRLALDYLGRTLATSSATGAGRALYPSRPQPTAVTRIVDTSATDVIAAGLRAVEWLGPQRTTSSAGSVVARLVAAEALLSSGESSLASSLVASVRREHPCLVPPTGSSSALVAMAQARRPGPSCRPVSPLQAGAYSIVPGMGNLAVNDRRTAAIGGGLVLAAFARALIADRTAKRRYSEYQAITDESKARLLYDSVREARGQRENALRLAGTLWVLDAFSAVLGARKHGERIANDRF
jgi:hypothetical protein